MPEPLLTIKKLVAELVSLSLISKALPVVWDAPAPVILTDLEPVVFLHYPPIYRDFKCEEILKVLAENKIKRCYYGHLHGKKSISHAFIGEYEGINFQLISGDAIGFNPVLVQ